MKIGIDVTPFVYKGTGVGDYTRHLVENLILQNPDDEFVFFYSTMRGFGRLRMEVEKLINAASSISPRSNKKVDKWIKTVGLPIPPSVWQTLWNRLNLIKIETFTGKLDIFHCWDYLIPPSSCKKIVTIHDATPLLFPETHTKKIINNYKLVIAKIIKEKINVITVSENSKKDLVKFGIDENLITVIYNGNNFSIDESQANYKKENYLLAVGTREPRKNLQRVIKAFVAISEKYPAFELRIVGKYGWGNNDDLIIKNLDSRIKEKIRILGYVSEEKLVELYKKATCLIYPSFYEGFGLPILEAMSLGCPVITSNVSSMPEVGGNAVMYVDPENSEDIKITILKVIESEEIRKELIKKGLNQAKKFSWQKCARETREKYQKVLNNKQ